ncbi:hypothetical protein ACEQ8H_003545 [Pleosporales sp. CAS-2024a]
MVKADPTRNYYADLKVAATASDNEIRKAYRALALQYHPDRNPGRETEVVVKFQEIQTAHEILCDPAQRLKYDAERRKYRNLNIPSNTPNTPRTRPPPPPRNAYTTTTPGGSYYRAAPPKPPPQQQQQQQQQPQRPPPPPHYASYAAGADRSTNKTFRPPPTAQRQDKAQKDAEARANVFTAWQKMKQPQHNPNGTPFGRSASTRAPSSRKGFDPGTPGGDERQARSAYRNYARPAPTPPSSTTPPHAPPFTKESPAAEAPYTEGTRMRTPYSSNTGGERMSMFEGLGRSASVRNSPSSARPSPGVDAGSFSDSGRRPQRNSYSGASQKPLPYMYTDSSDEEGEAHGLERAKKHRGPPVPMNSKRPPPPPMWGQNGFTTPQKPQPNGATGNMPNSFKSRSEESINVKFSPSDWHGKFESSSDYFAPKVPTGPSAKGRTSPTRGRPLQQNPPSSTSSLGAHPTSPLSQSQTQYPSFPIPPPPPGPPPNVNFPPAGEGAVPTAKFEPDEWAKHFKEPTWVFSESKETSPRRAADSTKRPKGSRKGSVQQDKRAAKATEKAEKAPRKKYQATADDADKADVDAMDIDSGTPPIPPPRPATNGTASQTNGTSATCQPPAAGLNGVNTALVDDDTFAPPQPADGIDLNSLSSTLPFPSAPSTMHPTKPATVQKLKFPHMPVPPVPLTSYTPATLESYFSRFETYCRDYMRATAAMTAHFVARDAELSSSLDERFAHTRGEGGKKLGFASYLKRSMEDEEVLQTWAVYQENHIKAMRMCEEVRNKGLKIFNGGAAGGV